MRGYEFKWSAVGRMKELIEFLRAYPNSTLERVDRSNYWQFLL